MKIHLVGGWKGSGKTTAIDKACNILKEKNIPTKVIQENFCDYDSLEAQIDLLKNGTDQGAIFVEINGSCTNPEETLLKPLRESADTSDSYRIEISNFSVVVDAQLLLPYLRGTDMPLSVEEKSTWEKQISVAEILVVSKVDLLSDCQFEAVQLFSEDYFPSKQIVLLDPFDIDSVNDWLKILSGEENKKDKRVDKESARLDEEIEITTEDNSAVEVLYEFMTVLSDDLVQKDIQAEHFEFFLSFDGESSRISHKELTDNNGPAILKDERSNCVNLLMDAYVYTSPTELRKILINRLIEYKSLEGVNIREKFVSLT